MSTDLIIPEEKILNKIYFIQGHKVMLDRDLAEMYGVETKRLKEAVRRNLDIFPTNFSDKMGLRHPPFAFTDHGILQLANVLTSKSARQMSIRIIEVFVKMREMLSSHKDILLKLEHIEKRIFEHDKRTSKNERDIKILFENN